MVLFSLPVVSARKEAGCSRHAHHRSLAIGTGHLPLHHELLCFRRIDRIPRFVIQSANERQGLRRATTDAAARWVGCFVATLHPLQLLLQFRRISFQIRYLSASLVFRIAASRDDDGAHPVKFVIVDSTNRRNRRARCDKNFSRAQVEEVSVLSGLASFTKERREPKRSDRDENHRQSHHQCRLLVHALVALSRLASHFSADQPSPTTSNCSCHTESCPDQAASRGHRPRRSWIGGYDETRRGLAAWLD